MYREDISSRGMKTNAVTPVVLGLLSLAPRSGYDIKTVVDRSTRFFWAASYGQIYPELRRLEEEGLIEGEDAPNGGRGRRVFKLTGAGHEALGAWLQLPDPKSTRLKSSQEWASYAGLCFKEKR